jgi:hypothetical protein
VKLGWLLLLLLLLVVLRPVSFHLWAQAEGNECWPNCTLYHDVTGLAAFYVIPAAIACAALAVMVALWQRFRR